MLRREDKAATFVPLDKRTPLAFLPRAHWPSEFAADPTMGEREALLKERAATKEGATTRAGKRSKTKEKEKEKKRQQQITETKEKEKKQQQQITQGEEQSGLTSGSGRADLNRTSQGQDSASLEAKETAGPQQRSEDDEEEKGALRVHSRDREAMVYVVRYLPWRASDRNPWCRMER